MATRHALLHTSLLLLLGAAGILRPAAAQVVAVVSAKSPVAALTPAQVADIFLGNSETFPGGAPAVPVDAPDETPLRQAFYHRVTGKSPATLKAHWSKLLFTGRGQPPREFSSIEELKRAIAANPRYIGYLDKSAVDAGLRIVMVAE